MKTEEYKQIEDMLERFFEGQTSNEEERILYHFFARTDLPPHLVAYKELFGYFETGIAREFPETPELRIPVRASVFNKRKLGWALALGAVAASFAFLLVNTLLNRQEMPFNPYEGSYIVRNGVVISDLDEIQPELEAIYLKVEAQQRDADRLLREVENLEYLSSMADRQLEERYQSLVRNILNKELQEEIYTELRTDQ